MREENEGAVRFKIQQVWGTHREITVKKNNNMQMVLLEIHWGRNVCVIGCKVQGIMDTNRNLCKEKKTGVHLINQNCVH